jgi:hypothetical protein
MFSAGGASALADDGRLLKALIEAALARKERRVIALIGKAPPFE